MRPAITIPTATLEELVSAARNENAYQTSPLGSTLGRLSEYQLAELVALSRVGLSQNGESEWQNALAKACALDESQRVASLLATDDLAEVIEDGLIEIGCALMNEQEMDAA